MLTRKIFPVILGILFIFSGCKNQKASEAPGTNPPPKTSSGTYSVKVESGGNAGEVEVVIPKKLWDGPVGDTIFNTLGQPFPGLPQVEPFYKTRQVDPENFVNIFKEHRNILIVKIEPHLKTGWKISHDVWAKNQIVITYQAPDEQEFYRIFGKTSQKLLDTLYKTTLLRYQQAYMVYLNKKDIDTLKKRYHISLIFPTTYSLDVKKKNFAWISRETATTSQEILVYITPYQSADDLEPDNIIRRRDSVAQFNVPGPSKGSYMQTEHLYPVSIERMTIDGHYAVLIRGLWKTHGDFMGGPFVNLSVLDAKRARIVTVDGFVYAGKQDKKLYLWQVEAIVRSLKILD